MLQLKTRHKKGMRRPRRLHRRLQRGGHDPKPRARRSVAQEVHRVLAARAVAAQGGSLQAPLGRQKVQQRHQLRAVEAGEGWGGVTGAIETSLFSSTRETHGHVAGLPTHEASFLIAHLVGVAIEGAGAVACVAAREHRLHKRPAPLVANLAERFHVGARQQAVREPAQVHHKVLSAEKVKTNGCNDEGNGGLSCWPESIV
jgi:hypothetical protein